MADDNHTTKSCSRCRQAQPATAVFFQPCIEYRDGFRGVCRRCERASQARRRASWVLAAAEGALKLCNLCHIEKPATTEFFQTQVMGKYGLRAQCRACRTVLNEGRGKAFAEGWEQVLDVGATKVCTKCHIEKPAKLEFFRARPEGHDGFRAQCRVCNDPVIKGWIRRNPGKARESVRKSVVRYRKTGKGKLNDTVQNAKRRARKVALPDQFTHDDWLFCLNYWAYSCAVCGNQEGFLWKIAADHWIPILDQEHCPGTVPWNMLPLCHGHGGCNNSKYANEPGAWLEKKLGKTKAKKKLQEIQVYFDNIRSI